MLPVRSPSSSPDLQPWRPQLNPYRSPAPYAPRPEAPPPTHASPEPAHESNDIWEPLDLSDDSRPGSPAPHATGPFHRGAPPHVPPHGAAGAPPHVPPHGAAGTPPGAAAAAHVAGTAAHGIVHAAAAAGAPLHGPPRGAAAATHAPDHRLDSFKFLLKLPAPALKAMLEKCSSSELLNLCKAGIPNSTALAQEMTRAVANILTNRFAPANFAEIKDWVHLSDWHWQRQEAHGGRQALRELDLRQLRDFGPSHPGKTNPAKVLNSFVEAAAFEHVITNFFGSTDTVHAVGKAADVTNVEIQKSLVTLPEFGFFKHLAEGLSNRARGSPQTVNLKLSVVIQKQSDQPYTRHTLWKCHYLPLVTFLGHLEAPANKLKICLEYETADKENPFDLFGLLRNGHLPNTTSFVTDLVFKTRPTVDRQFNSDVPAPNVHRLDRPVNASAFPPITGPEMWPYAASTSVYMFDTAQLSHERALFNHATWLLDLPDVEFHEVRGTRLIVAPLLPAAPGVSKRVVFENVSIPDWPFFLDDMRAQCDDAYRHVFNEKHGTQEELQLHAVPCLHELVLRVVLPEKFPVDERPTEHHSHCVSGPDHKETPDDWLILHGLNHAYKPNPEGSYLPEGLIYCPGTRKLYAQKDTLAKQLLDRLSEAAQVSHPSSGSLSLRIEITKPGRHATHRVSHLVSTDAPPEHHKRPASQEPEGKDQVKRRER